MNFRNFILQNFPFLEDDFDALTDYELFCKMMSYVKVFAKDNKEFKKKLEDFENYFNNLDVQEEIDNKLDEMASDGTLAEIINEEIFTELSNNVDDILDTTLNTNVEILPDTLKDNNEYTIIQSEDNLSSINDLPLSYYRNLKNAIETINYNKSHDLIKVATFNIQNENVPYTNGVDGIKKLTKLQNIYNELGATIIGLNEVFDYTYYPASNFTCTENLPYFNMVTTISNIKPFMNYGEGILSNLQKTSTSDDIYSSYHSPEHQGYVKNVYSYNGHSLSFYTTHFCYNDDDTVRGQIAELYAVVSADANDYKIIVGDFNFDTSEYADYLALFIQDDYKVVNGGQYKTYDDARNLGIDEILISPNLDIISSGVGNNGGLSDHFPLYATLEFK